MVSGPARVLPPHAGLSAVVPVSPPTRLVVVQIMVRSTKLSLRPAKPEGFTITQITHNTDSEAAPRLDCCGSSSAPVAARNCHSTSTAAMDTR